MYDFGTTVVDGGDNFKEWPSDGDKVALLDGDLLPYIVGYTVPENKINMARIQVQMGVAETLSDSSQFKDAADHMNWLINSWVRGAECDAMRLFLTESADNYRLGIAFSKEYKGQRTSDKPPFFYELRAYLKEKHGAIVAKGCEADDLISIEMHAEAKRLGLQGVEPGSPEHFKFTERVCVTIDKDLAINPGVHYLPKTQHNEAKLYHVDTLGSLEPVWKIRETKTKGPVQYISKLKGTGLKFFYAQILMGDTADNYPGLPQCGAARALEVCDPCSSEEELFYAVLAEYKAKWPSGVWAKNHRGGKLYLTAYQMMLEQGRLAWMQTVPGEIWRAKSELPHGEDTAWLQS